MFKKINSILEKKKVPVPIRLFLYVAPIVILFFVTRSLLS